MNEKTILKIINKRAYYIDLILKRIEEEIKYVDFENLYFEILAKINSKRELETSNNISYFLSSFRNALIDEIRKENSSPIFYNEKDDTLFEAYANYSPSPYDELVIAEKENEASEVLTPEQKEIISLKLDDKTYKEIAEEMNITEDRVHNQVKVIREKLELIKKG